MISRYNKMSIAIGLPGFLMQIAAYVTGSTALQAVGTVLLLIGLLLYAQAKGRNPLWCLMAFVPVVGIIVLACLKDKMKDHPGVPEAPPLPEPKHTVKAKRGEAWTCPACGEVNLEYYDVCRKCGDDVQRIIEEDSEQSN